MSGDSGKISGYVKINRSLIDWEWYTCANTMRLFIHCVLRANWEPKIWKGITIERGQFITSYNTLKRELDLSTQNIRTSFSKMKLSGEVTRKATKRMTIVTVCNFDVYNRFENEANKETNIATNKELTGNQQGSNREVTTDKNVKNIKNSTYNDNAPVQMCADANDNKKPKAGKCLLQFLELYQSVKSFNPRAEYRNIQNALYEAVALDGESKVMQSLEDFVYYVNRTNDRNFTKAPVKWLEDCQFQTDWLLRVDAFNKGKNSMSDNRAFRIRDEKYPKMKWEN